MLNESAALKISVIYSQDGNYKLVSISIPLLFIRICSYRNLYRSTVLLRYNKSSLRAQDTWHFPTASICPVCFEFVKYTTGGELRTEMKNLRTLLESVKIGFLLPSWKSFRQTKQIFEATELRNTCFCNCKLLF